MNYILTLILEKEAPEEKIIAKIKKYLAGKEDELIEQKTKSSSILILEIKIDPQEVEKLKKKIKKIKGIRAILLQKKGKIKKIKEKTKKTKKKPKKTIAKTNKTKKVLASMQEEEKKIKDLDSTLDKILNE